MMMMNIMWWWRYDVDGDGESDDDDMMVMLMVTSFSSMVKVVGAFPIVQVVPRVVLLAEKIEVKKEKEKK